VDFPEGADGLSVIFSRAANRLLSVDEVVTDHNSPSFGCRIEEPDRGR
jgi:hypothetical protein